MSCDSLHDRRLAIVAVPCDTDVEGIVWPAGTVVLATSEHHFFDKGLLAIKVRHTLMTAIGDNMTIPSYTLDDFVAIIRHLESIQ